MSVSTIHHVAVTSDAGLGRKRTWCDTEVVQIVKTFRVAEIWNKVREETILEDICKRSHPIEAKIPETEKKAASPEEKIEAKQAPVIEQCGQAAGDERERGLTRYGA